MWPHSESPSSRFCKLSRDWEQVLRFDISSLLPTSFPLSAGLSYIEDLGQKMFLRSHLISPGWCLSLWRGVWTEIYLVASARDLEFVATMHNHCLDFRKVLWMTFQWRFFLCLLPLEELLFALVVVLLLEFTQKKTYCLLSLGVLKGFCSSHSDVKKFSVVPPLEHS